MMCNGQMEWTVVMYMVMMVCANIGRDNLRLISSSVTPLEIDEENNVVKIKVHQVVYDINGNLLSDDIVYHYFTLKDGKIARFNIGNKHSSK